MTANTDPTTPLLESITAFDASGAEISMEASALACVLLGGDSVPATFNTIGDIPGLDGLLAAAPNTPTTALLECATGSVSCTIDVDFGALRPAPGRGRRLPEPLCETLSEALSEGCLKHCLNHCLKSPQSLRRCQPFYNESMHAITKHRNTLHQRYLKSQSTVRPPHATTARTAHGHRHGLASSVVSSCDCVQTARPSSPWTALALW